MLAIIDIFKQGSYRKNIVSKEEHIRWHNFKPNKSFKLGQMWCRQLHSWLLIGTIHINYRPDFTPRLHPYIGKCTHFKLIIDLRLEHFQTRNSSTQDLICKLRSSSPQISKAKKLSSTCLVNSAQFVQALLRKLFCKVGIDRARSLCFQVIQLRVLLFRPSHTNQNPVCCFFAIEKGDIPPITFPGAGPLGHMSYALLASFRCTSYLWLMLCYEVAVIPI